MSDKRNFDADRRRDLEIIAGLVTPGSRVLDLGCGDGIFLRQLKEEKNASVLGVEIDQDSITAGDNVYNIVLGRYLGDNGAAYCVVHRHLVFVVISKICVFEVLLICPGHMPNDLNVLVGCLGLYVIQNVLQINVRIGHTAVCTALLNSDNVPIRVKDASVYRLTLFG